MNASPHRLMAVFAHPDDESLVMGGALAKYASEGVDTHLLMATRGERGRYGLHPVSPGTEIVGKTREQELLAAAGHLGVKEVSFLDYMDGDLDKVDAEEIITKIALHIRRVRPQVVATFGPDGAYGHPDHVAISQFTTAAIVKAADPTFRTAAFGGECNGGLSKDYDNSSCHKGALEPIEVLRFWFDNKGTMRETNAHGVRSLGVHRLLS